MNRGDDNVMLSDFGDSKSEINREVEEIKCQFQAVHWQSDIGYGSCREAHKSSLLVPLCILISDGYLFFV